MKRYFLIGCVAVSIPLQAALFTGHQSIDDLKAKIGRLPENGHSRTKANLYSELGMQLYRQGATEEAALQYEKALEQDTSRAMRRQIYLYLGKSYESSGRIDKAIDAYEEAVQYDSKNWKRHRDLAGLYELSRLYQKAIDSYREAFRLNPREGSVLLAMGRTWRKMGLYKQASGALGKAAEVGADSKEVCKELSAVYEGQSQFQAAAVACFRSAIEPSSSAEWGRIVYLSALAGDKEMTKRGIAKLKAIPESKETIQFYESLVQLMDQKPEQILSMSTGNPALRELFDSLQLKESSQ